MVKAFLSLVAVGALLGGLILAGFGFTMATGLTGGSALMTCGMIFFLAGVVIASAVELHSAIDEARTEFHDALKFQAEESKKLRELIEKANASGDRTNQLLEWVGEIQGETLRYHKKGE